MASSEVNQHAVDAVDLAKAIGLVRSRLSAGQATLADVLLWVIEQVGPEKAREVSPLLEAAWNHVQAEASTGSCIAPGPASKPILQHQEAIVAEQTATRASASEMLPWIRSGCPTSSPRSELSYPDAPVGIGGWLIFHAMNMVVTPLLVLVCLLGILAFVSSPDWEARITPGTDKFSPDFAFGAVVTGIVLTAFLAYLIVVAVFFFKKKRQTVTLMVILLPFLHGFDFLIILALEDRTKPVWSRATSSIILAGIWIAYWLKSKRVANTFVN